jgi:hypothetical protein
MHGRLLIATALGLIVTAGPALAAAEQLWGQRFIDVMQDNTLSGETTGGAPFNMYFLPGGEVTYDDASGGRDHGRWRMDPDGDVCVQGRDHCFAVYIEGDRISWRDKAASGENVLRGGVADTFLKPRQ